MLVDNNPLIDAQFYQQDHDLSEYLNTDLFLNAPSSSSSRASSPQSPFQSLLTPPQSQPIASFPEIYESPPAHSSNGFFNFVDDDDIKLADPQPVSPSNYAYFGTFRAAAQMDHQSTMGIDPQLVGTPSNHTSPAHDEEVPEQSQSKQEEPKMTLTIAPIKVAGHGKSRKGTVQSGGVVKKAAAAATVPPLPAPVPIQQVLAAPSPQKENDFDNDDDLPADWRPPPEVFAKMSSKEKRQLRNKISARNFRVRRKEYITTLELDIAERDRLLHAIRAELGTTQSENQALRQEISALKRALLEGRSASELTVEDIPVLNLPPPGPLPTTAAPAPAAPRTSSPSPSILAPNTQKDVASSSSANSFWGGVRMGGGFTPVHTILMPDMNKAALEEHDTPVLNAESRVKAPGFDKVASLDGFNEASPFTLKNFEAFCTQLAPKQISQYPVSPPSSALSSPRSSEYSLSPFAKPASMSYFAGSPFGHNSSNHELNPTLYNYQPTSSAILSGKHHLASPPPSPMVRPHSPTSSRQQEQHQLMIAALASHTLLQKLGSAFLEALAASNSSPSVGMDAEKVRKILEGNATLQVVEVEERREMGPLTRKTMGATAESTETRPMAVLLEESMQSLTLGKK